MDNLKIGNKILSSRLLVGTGKYPSYEVMKKSIENSNTNMVTMALRRVNLENKKENIIDYIPKDIILLPNTSGARDHKEAVRIARIGRELGCGNFVKIEVISDQKYLFPDNYETIKATEILAKEGFHVLPYMNPDLMVAKELERVGAAAVMPLGAPIGSNKGLKTKELIKILIDEIEVPIIVDAGIGKPSQACEAMELGADAVLVNTAIASSQNPELMALAFKNSVISGRQAYKAKLGSESNHAIASSPLTGFLNEVE